MSVSRVAEGVVADISIRWSRIHNALLIRGARGEIDIALRCEPLIPIKRPQEWDRRVKEEIASIIPERLDSQEETRPPPLTLARCRMPGSGPPFRDNRFAADYPHSQGLRIRAIYF